MAWTAPKTWTAEPLTSSDLNTYIRDNQNYLKALHGNNQLYEVNEVSNYTTSSTSLVVIDNTNLNLSLTTTGEDVRVTWYGNIKATAFAHVTLYVDGSDYLGEEGIGFTHAGSTYGTLMSFTIRVTGLSAGAHTFALYWRVNSGSATYYAGDGTANLSPISTFFVEEC